MTSASASSGAEHYLNRARRYPVSVAPGGLEPFVATCPDFPDAVAFGDTPEEAFLEAFRAIGSFIQVFEETGRPVPEPSSEYAGHAPLRLPESMRAALVRRAREEGTSVDAVLSRLVAQGLGEAA